MSWGVLEIGVTLTLAVLVAAAACRALRGGYAYHLQSCRLVCPRFDEAVSCDIVQDVRTGRWTSVETCSAFSPPGALLCAQECRPAMNAGRLAVLVSRSDTR